MYLLGMLVSLALVLVSHPVPRPVLHTPFLGLDAPLGAALALARREILDGVGEGLLERLPRAEVGAREIFWIKHVIVPVDICTSSA